MTIAKFEFSREGIGNERVLLDGLDITKHVKDLKVSAAAGALTQVYLSVLGDPEIQSNSEVHVRIDIPDKYLEDTIEVSGMLYKRIHCAADES